MLHTLENQKRSCEACHSHKHRDSWMNARRYHDAPFSLRCATRCNPITVWVYYRK
jgi:hypothetical protein